MLNSTLVAYILIPELAANKVMRQWIDKVKYDGARSFELRVKIGEAAHFVADYACALGKINTMGDRYSVPHGPSKA